MASSFAADATSSFNRAIANPIGQPTVTVERVEFASDGQKSFNRAIANPIGQPIPQELKVTDGTLKFQSRYRESDRPAEGAALAPTAS